MSKHTFSNGAVWIGLMEDERVLIAISAGGADGASSDPVVWAAVPAQTAQQICKDIADAVARKLPKMRYAKITQTEEKK